MPNHTKPDPHHNPGIVKESSHPALPALYGVVLLGTIGFLIKTYLFEFDNYSETELVEMSFYFIPTLVFSLTGFAFRKSDKSLVIAIVSTVLGTGFLAAFYATAWPSL